MKKLLVSAVFLIIGVTASFAEAMERSVTYNVSSKGEITVTGLEPTGSVAEYTNTSGKTYKMSSGCSSTFTLKNYDGYIVKGLILQMHSNITKKDGSCGAGTFYFKIGNNILAEIVSSTEFNKWYNNTQYTNQKTDIIVTIKDDYINGYKVEIDENLEITISATKDALYIDGYTIIYEKPDDLIDAPRITSTNGDVFYRKQRIDISCEADVDAIYFTTDGTEPTTASQKYDANAPLYIENTVVKAFAVKDNERTKVSTKIFTKEYPKIITVRTDNNYFGMTNKSSDKTHMDGKNVFVYDNSVICDPEDFIVYAVLLDYEKNKIQNYTNKEYLFYTKNEVDIGYNKNGKDDTDIWLFTDDGRMCQQSYTNRRISFSNTYEYFGTFSAVSPNYFDAYPLDLVKGYTRDGLSPNKIGTICLPYDVLNDDRIGATFYNILGKKTDENGNVESLILEEETETLIAGKPYIFEATDDALCCMYLDYVEKEDAAQAGGNHNGLYGSLEGMDVASGLYLITNNSIVKCGTGCSIAANRAYINMKEVEELNEAQQLSGRMLTISIGGGNLTNIEAAAIENTNNTVIYNMQGQRITAPAKGVYIVNGKKVILK